MRRSSIFYWPLKRRSHSLWTDLLQYDHIILCSCRNVDVIHSSTSSTNYFNVSSTSSEYLSGYFRIGTNDKGIIILKKNRKLSYLSVKCGSLVMNSFNASLNSNAMLTPARFLDLIFFTKLVVTQKITTTSWKSIINSHLEVVLRILLNLTLYARKHIGIKSLFYHGGLR